MRILSFAGATIFCGVGCTFYGVQALNPNSLGQQESASVISSDTNDEDVRSQAARALGLKGDARAVEPLRNALNDPDANVRKQARWALDLRQLKIGKRIVKESDLAVKDR